MLIAVAVVGGVVVILMPSNWVIAGVLIIIIHLGHLN